MSLILLEGVDGSGKSTLVDDFLLQLPHTGIHFSRGPLKLHPLIEYLLPLVDYRPGIDIVCDRWHLGELVYGPLYRARSRLTPAMELYIDLFLESRGALKLWVDTPYEQVQTRLKIRGEDFLQEQHVRLVWDFFRDHSPTHGWEAISGAVQKQKRAELITELIAKAYNLSAAAFGNTWRGYVGPNEPKVVMVANHHSTDPRRPSFGPLPWVPFEDSPGHYVLAAIASQLDFPSFGILHPNSLSYEFFASMPADTLVIGFGRPISAAISKMRIRQRSISMQDPAVGTRSLHTVSRYGEFLKDRIARA